jgi:hypothetical protein
LEGSRPLRCLSSDVTALIRIRALFFLFLMHFVTNIFLCISTTLVLPTCDAFSPAFLGTQLQSAHKTNPVFKLGNSIQTNPRSSVTPAMNASEAILARADPVGQQPSITENNSAIPNETSAEPARRRPSRAFSVGKSPEADSLQSLCSDNEDQVAEAVQKEDDFPPSSTAHAPPDAVPARMSLLEREGVWWRRWPTPAAIGGCIPPAAFSLVLEVGLQFCVSVTLSVPPLPIF